MLVQETQQIIKHLALSLQTDAGKFWGAALGSIEDPFAGENLFTVPAAFKSHHLGKTAGAACQTLMANGMFIKNHQAASDHQTDKLPLLPLSTFRWGADAFFCGKSIEKTFLSSGTTQSTRAQSHFSTDGLLLYKMGSLLTFAYVLQSMGFISMKEAIGISWIPSKQVWPQSSLAAMVSWFSEYFNLIYADSGNIPRSNLGNKPVWLFSTAYDLSACALERKLRMPLPKGSIVIETGGMKGRTLDLTRDELYQKVAEAFSITPTDIVSEYGMGELASQAYDWVPRNSSRDNRFLRFPRWVKVFTSEHVDEHPQTSCREEEKSDAGVLSLWDGLRIDYPYVLRTSDLVLGSRQNPEEFIYVKRISHAPLKGCSLKSEELHLEKAGPEILYNDHQVEHLDFSVTYLKGMVERCRKIADQLQSFLTSNKFTSLLKEEFSNHHIGLLAAKDLTCLMPKNEVEFLLAALSSLGISAETIQNLKKGGGFLSEKSGGQPPDLTEILDLVRKALPTYLPKNIPKNWLFIGPSSHSIALIEPIIFAFICGINLEVKLSTRLNSQAISALISFLGTLNASFKKNTKIIQKERLGLNSAINDPLKKILIFGSHETISLLRGLGYSCRGFGNYLSGSFIDGTKKSDIRLLIKDALSLGQQGCFSSRFAFVFLSDANKKALEEVLNHILVAGDKFLKKTPKKNGHEAREDEFFRYIMSLKIDAHWSPDKNILVPILGLKRFKKQFLTSNFPSSAWLSLASYVLPVVVVSNEKGEEPLLTIINALKKNLPDLRRLSCSTPILQELKKSQAKDPIAEDIFLTPVGSANMSDWSGLHQGQPYFSDQLPTAKK